MQVHVISLYIIHLFISVACFKGHQNKSFYVKAAISPDDQFLLSGSSNEMAYIWKVYNVWLIYIKALRECHDCDRMVVGLTTTCATSAYHH